MIVVGENTDSVESNNEEQSAGRAGSDTGRREFKGNRDAAGQGDRARAGAMEVVVSHNIDKAMKVLKRKLIKEGLFKELKSRRYYEKPSEKRKRKEKESRKKQRKEEARIKKGPVGLF